MFKYYFKLSSARHANLDSLCLELIAERRERSERSEANNRVLFEIPRYLYIYIYIYICMSVRTCLAQDRAHLTQVLTSAIVDWNTGCCSDHHFEESPFR